jgi:hypothetical protein
MLEATRAQDRVGRERWIVRFRDAALSWPQRFLLELLERRILLTRDPGDLVTYDPGSIFMDSLPAYIPVTGTSVDHVTVATFHGPADLRYAAVTDWGDGTSDAEPIVALADGSFAVIGTHDYAGARDETGHGDYEVGTSITASDGSSSDSSATLITSVNGMKFIEDPETDTPLGQSTIQDSLVRFLDSDPVADSDYKVSIDWGDGTTSGGRVQTSTWGTLDVYGDHLYGRSGTFPLSVAVSRKGQTITSTGSAVTSDDTLANVQVIEGPRYFALAGTSVNDQVLCTFRGPNDSADQYSATIWWDDDTSSSAKIIETGEGQYAVVGSHDYASKDVFGLDIQVFASGVSDAVLYDTRYILTQADPIEVIDGPGFRTYASANPQPFTVASFVDLDPLDGESYDVMIDWGDGTRWAGEALDRGFGAFDIEASRAFPTVGSYRMRVTITRGSETFRTDGPIHVLDPHNIVPDRPVAQPDDGAAPPPPTATAFAPPRPAPAQLAPFNSHFATIAQQMFDADRSIKGIDDGLVDPLA